MTTLHGVASRVRRGSFLVLSLILILSIIAAALGWGFWFLALFVAGLLTVSLARWLGWTTALAGSVVLMLVAETIVLRFLPATGLRLLPSHLIVWGSVSLLLTAWLGSRREPLRALSAANLRSLRDVVAVPLLVGATVLAVALATGFRMISWAMNNDAVWTTMSARHIMLDGGVDTGSHRNSSTLMAALMAVMDSSGREHLGAGELLRHDVVVQAQLWFVLWIVTAVFVGLIFERAMRAASALPRALVTALGSSIVFTWYVSGLAIDLGFYSASLATLLLFVVWVIALDARRHPVAGFALELCGATALLATWAPLAVVPLAIATLVFVRNRRAFFSVFPLPWIGAVLQFVLYVGLVAVPDFIAERFALAAQGAVPGLGPVVFTLLLVLTVAAGVLLGVRTGKWDEPLVLFAVVVGSVFGLGALLGQSPEQGTTWSYYPLKFSWLVAILLVVLLGSMLARIVSTAAWPVGVRVLAVVGSLALVVGLMAQTPPAKPGLVATAPFVDIVAGPGSGWLDLLAERVFQYSDVSERNLLSRYSSTVEDRYVDMWLLQLTADSSQDPVRYFAYFLDPADPSQVCDAIEAWGHGTTVRTTDPNWESKLRAECPDADFSVVVHEPVTPKL